MIRLIMPLLVLLLVCPIATDVVGAERVHPHAMTICAIIINEMTEGKISQDKAKQISLAIAHAGNRHFGRVTCGDMWLYMAMVYIESGFKNNIVNELNCRGMFQVHAPSWARKFGLTYGDLLDLHTNADSGIRVFKYYLELYKKTVPALSAYNSDDPRAATGYARAVLNTRLKIKKRYTELYRALHDEQVVAFNPNGR
ncbi:MAG: lytic transglycosylase domain-containing protein [Desulfomonile tiedjei]|nr:lytic transglycosylase domain-containing protein [Desulfomonile tiedjei]